MAVARNPKGATIDLGYYESPSVIASFDNIKASLLRELRPQQPQIQLEARDLSLLIAQIQQFQIDNLGIHNRPNQCPLRIPAKLFKLEEPLDEKSPVYKILLAAYTYRISHGWHKFEFNPAKRTKYMDMVRFIREFLINEKVIQQPRIAFARSLGETERKTLTSMAKKLQMQVVDEPSQATHVLYGPLHQYDSAEEEWFRTLEKKDGRVLVHWWYYPDSYDSWLPQTDQFADPEEPPNHKGPWHITARWLQDSAKFNEQMNEEDYEELENNEEVIKEEEQEQAPSSSFSEIKTEPGLHVKSVNGNSSNNQQASERRASSTSTTTTPALPVLNPNHQPAVRIRDIEKERPQLGLRQRKNEFEPYSNGDITNISQYTTAYIDLPPPRRKVVVAREEEEQSEEEEKDKEIHDLCSATPQDYSQVSAPDWFDASTIHDIEKLALPEYFKYQGRKGDKAVQEYKKCRDYMIQAYRENPSYYLTISSCKAALKNVDLVQLVRIHSFLEQACLINHQIDPRRRMFDPYIDSEPDAGIQRPGSQRDDWTDTKKPDMQLLRDLIYNDREDTSGSRTSSTWDINIYDDKNPDARDSSKCTSCGQSCEEVRYQSLKYKKLQVCPDCFLEGKFTATTWKGEFLRVEKGERADLPEDNTTDWNENEILRLLEAVDAYDDDWLAISEHVGTRSKEQCITQFLQLPITDEFLTARLSDKELKELPFGDQPNPVMALVAFLSGHVNPGIGSAAAKRAMKELFKKEDSDRMDIDDGEEAAAFSQEDMRQATIAALQSAVEQARKLAAYENEDIQLWTRLAIKTLIDKLMLKVQQYDDQENYLENELRELEKQGSALASSLEALYKQYPNIVNNNP